MLRSFRALSLCGIFCGIAALSGGLTPLDAAKWQMKYFYDKDKSTLAISDLRFASPTRGVAVGAIVEGRQDRKSVV